MKDLKFVCAVQSNGSILYWWYSRVEEMPWAYNTPRKKGRRRKSGKKMRNVATAVLGAGCIANSADTDSGT